MINSSISLMENPSLERHPPTALSQWHFTVCASRKHCPQHRLQPRCCGQHQMIKMPLNSELYIVQQHNICDLYALHHQTRKTPAVCTRLTCAQHRAHPSLLPAPGSNPSCCWLAKQHKPGTEQQMEKGNADSSAWPAHRGAQTALAMYI